MYGFRKKDWYIAISHLRKLNFVLVRKDLYLHGMLEDVKKYFGWHGNPKAFDPHEFGVQIYGWIRSVWNKKQNLVTIKKKEISEYLQDLGVMHMYPSEKLKEFKIKIKIWLFWKAVSEGMTDEFCFMVTYSLKIDAMII